MLDPGRLGITPDWVWDTWRDVRRWSDLRCPLVRRTPHGLTYPVAERQVFGGRIYVTDGRVSVYESWQYPTWEGTLMAFLGWGPAFAGDAPDGWTRATLMKRHPCGQHVPVGWRRRPDGDPAREYTDA